MSKRKPKGPQLPTLPPSGDLPQLSFNLEKNDSFINSLGIDFIHWKAVPSPIGLKDRGDYRRPDSLDTISSNGMLYIKAGCFTATMVDNSKKSSYSDGGLIDPSTSRLILPRFYNKGDEQSNADRIYMVPGDRVYIADPHADDLVSNYQRMEYSPSTGIDIPMFPIKKIEFIQDSRGIIYDEGYDFKINCDGNVEWLAEGRNPGTDPETKTGRVYSIRYQYKAHWYVVDIPREVRLTNITKDGVRSPERMPYHVVIQREYIYRNKNNGDSTQTEPDGKEDSRTRQAPPESISPSDPIKVDMSAFEDEEDDNL
jgi:hypothetical protein